MFMHPRARSLLLLAPLVVAAPASAKEPTPREIIGDYDRIVTPDGVQESYRVTLGGVEQWVYVRGQSRRNPLLLFVHGGPASPLSPAMWMWQRPLEEYFTVVQYDQRGAGRSYGEADPRAVAPTLTVQRYVDDAVELTRQLEQRYHVPKLLLAGHSWGTVVALKAAVAHPELYAAYVGLGQVISTRENERISYDFAVAQATRHGNQPALAELRAIAPYPGDQPLTRERIVTARRWAQFYGGLSAYRDQSRYFFDAPLLSPDYDAAAVDDIDKGNLLTLGRILPEFLAIDLRGITKLAIPVFMFMGRHDYTTPTAPTERWLGRLEAPAKRAVWFENSAHLVPFEEPGKLLVSLLEYVRPLAPLPALK